MKISVLFLAALAAPAAAAPLEVHVDPRVELVATVFRLAGSREYGQGNTPYVAAVKARFAKFADHPAVAAARELRDRWSIGYDAPMQLALYLDPTTLRPLRPLAPPPRGMDDRWKGAPIEPFLEKLRDFDRRSGFRAFLAEQAPYFARVEERFRSLADKRDLRPWLESYYGPRAGARSVVVPGVQSGGNNFGITVQLPDGSEVLSQILSLESPDGEGLPRLTDGTLALWAHEASHPYVNPLVDQHLAELEGPGRALHALVAEQMRKQAYPEPRIMLCESLVRASVILFLGDKLGPAAARREARAQDARGFFWIEELAAKIDEVRRSRHATLAEAMPEIAATFRDVAERAGKEGVPRRPFRGPIDAVFSSGALVYVASPALLEYVREMKARFHEEAAPLLPAAGASWKDAPGAAVLYGSPASNPLVAQTLASAGDKVEAGAITVGGRKLEGADLVLIEARRHAGDPLRGVLVYTAASDELLAGVNGVFHGPTDWVVARRLAPGKYETVASGDF